MQSGIDSASQKFVGVDSSAALGAFVIDLVMIFLLSRSWY